MIGLAAGRATAMCLALNRVQKLTTNSLQMLYEDWLLAIGSQLHSLII